MRTYILLINYGYFIKRILRIYEAYLTVNPGMVLYVKYGGSSMRREYYVGGQICNSIISLSCKIWSWLTRCPSNFPDPHTSAYFSFLRKSL
jgi:hypothetical protein